MTIKTKEFMKSILGSLIETKNIKMYLKVDLCIGNDRKYQILAERKIFGFLI